MINKVSVESMEFVKKWYKSATLDREETERFCNQYMDMFDEVKGIVRGLPLDRVYELLDDIYIECDLYEPDIAIRKAEPYYFDEQQLHQRIGKYLSSLEALEQE